MNLPIAVVGGGSFGQSLAQAAARVGQRVVLWSRQQRTLDDERIGCTTELRHLSEAELVFFAVPSTHVSHVADKLGHYLDGSHLLVHVSRGLVSDDLVTVGEVLSSRTPCRRVGVLAGPLVAKNLASGKEPGGALIGSPFPEVVEAVSEALVGPSLRVYNTPDMMGVEIASALVGLVALALGYAQQLGMGPGAQAVLATRGLAEATRVGVVRGGEARTFAGLAGAGDLMAAVAGDGRPEIDFGKALAQGLSAEQAAERVGAFIEGGALARRVAAFGLRSRIDVPLATGLAKLMAGQLSVNRLIEELMSRPAVRE